MHIPPFNPMHYALCIMLTFIVGTATGAPKSYAISELCIIMSCVMSKCTVYQLAVLVTCDDAVPDRSSVFQVATRD